MESARLFRALGALGLLGLLSGNAFAGVVLPTSVIPLPTSLSGFGDIDVSVDAPDNRMFVAVAASGNTTSSVDIVSLSGSLISSIDWSTFTGQPGYPLRVQYLPGSGQLLVLSEKEITPGDYTAQLYELSLKSGGGATVDKILNVQSIAPFGGLTATSAGVWVSNGGYSPTISRISLTNGSVLQTIQLKDVGPLQLFGDIAPSSNGFLYSTGSEVSPVPLFNVDLKGTITAEAELEAIFGLDANPAANTIYAIQTGEVDVYKGVKFTSVVMPLPAAFWPAFGILGILGAAAVARKGIARQFNLLS